MDVLGQPLALAHEDRTEPRDEVFHRTRLTLGGDRIVKAIVVNLSPHGLMARADADIAMGESIRLALPVIGATTATVRWSLGGRIGCRLDQPIDPATYGSVLTAARG